MIRCLLMYDNTFKILETLNVLRVHMSSFTSPPVWFVHEYKPSTGFWIHGYIQTHYFYNLDQLENYIRQWKKTKRLNDEN